MNSRIKELYTNRERHNIIHLTEIMKTFLSEHMITDHEKVQPSRSQVIAGEKFLIENKALIDASMFTVILELMRSLTMMIK